MSKLKNMRERVHQPFYDTLVRGQGTTAIANQFQLFGSANIGNPALTNMQQAAQFPSDNTVIVKAIRCAMYFQATNDDEFNVAFGALPAITGALADNARALDMYSQMAYGGYFTFIVGNKPMINAPLWYAPAGGGISAWSTATGNGGRNVASNGLPSHEAILKLAKDIQVVARQNIALVVNFFPFPVLGTGAGGATISAAVSPLDELNAFDGIKDVQFILDGILTRDVQ